MPPEENKPDENNEPDYKQQYYEAKGKLDQQGQKLSQIETKLNEFKGFDINDHLALKANYETLLEKNKGNKGGAEDLDAYKAQIKEDAEKAANQAWSEKFQSIESERNKLADQNTGYLKETNVTSKIRHLFNDDPGTQEIIQDKVNQYARQTENGFEFVGADGQKLMKSPDQAYNVNDFGNHLVQRFKYLAKPEQVQGSRSSAKTYDGNPTSITAETYSQMTRDEQKKAVPDVMKRAALSKEILKRQTQ